MEIPNQSRDNMRLKGMILKLDFVLNDYCKTNKIKSYPKKRIVYLQSFLDNLVVTKSQSQVL